jgi:uncharacterized protein YbjT (DUF2867 family)
MAAAANHSFMKIVILGGAGQVGSLLRPAIETGFPADEVVATSRKPGHKIFEFDPFSDDWRSLGNADILINAIGAIDATKEHSLEKVHVGVVNKIIENYKQIGSPRIINISALGANPIHRTQFLRTKGIADERLIKTIPGVVILRPSIIYTSGTMIVRKIKILLSWSRFLGNKVLLPKKIAQTLIQPISANDFAGIVVNIIKCKEYQGIIELAGPETYTFQQLIELQAIKRGHKVRFRFLNTYVSDFVIPLLFSWLIRKEQYNLLKEDNISKNNAAEKILGRALSHAWT